MSGTVKKQYTIVNDKSSYDAMMKHLSDHSYFAFDVETTGLNVRKDKVIGFSICGEAGVAFYYPIYSWDTNKEELLPVPGNMDKVQEVLSIIKSKEILTWNGSFDCRVTKNSLGVDLIDSMIADGMLMAHTLREEGPFGLKKVGVIFEREIGYEVGQTADEEAQELKENVQRNGGSITKANYEMFKADLAVLGKYAASDADITFRLCDMFNGMLEKEGLTEFFFDDEVMPLYREVTIPMEDRGVKIDLELIKSTKKQVELDLINLETEIISLLFEDEGTVSWYNKCVDEFTKLSNKGNFAQGLVDFYELDIPKSDKTKKYLMNKKNINNLEEGVIKNFLLGQKCWTLPEDHITAIKNNIYIANNPKKINISSKTQLSQIVFDHMGVKPLSKTPTGKNKFDDQMISLLSKEGHKWALLLGDYNKLIKIKGTYLDRFLDNQEDGVYYFSYKQHGTISGRYGSDAQQLPRPKEEGQLSPLVLKHTNTIRKFFISGPGRFFVDCDYESLEPHVFAHVSNEEGIKDIFRNGHDFYSTIAINTEMLDGVSPDKKAENYLGKVDKERRQSAKAYALGVPYGMGGYALGKTLDIPTEDAEELVKNYLGAYPNLNKWIKETKIKVRKDGYISTQVGRIRHLPKVKDLYKKHKDKLLDYKYRNKIGARMVSDIEGKSGHDLVKEMYKDFKNGQNNSINFQIQSLSASIVNRAAIAINRYFKEQGVDGWCCAQIHDQLIVNIPENLKEEHAKKVQYLMENTTKLSLDLKAPPSLAINWFDGH